MSYNATKKSERVRNDFGRISEQNGSFMGHLILPKAWRNNDRRKTEWWRNDDGKNSERFRKNFGRISEQIWRMWLRNFRNKKIIRNWVWLIYWSPWVQSDDFIAFICSNITSLNLYISIKERSYFLPHIFERNVRNSIYPYRFRGLTLQWNLVHDYTFVKILLINTNIK
jgi:hypothetical protein